MAEQSPRVPARREFATKVAGLENHTFDIGHAKYVAKFKKSFEEIANYIQREYKGGPDIGKAMRELRLPALAILILPAGADAAEMFLWQGEATNMQKRIAQLEENTQKAYALMIGQCSLELVNKISREGAGCHPTASHYERVLLQIR